MGEKQCWMVGRWIRIPDSAFIDGIEFLIKDGILKIS